mgnify:CR=1 FL=1
MMNDVRDKRARVSRGDAVAFSLFLGRRRLRDTVL